MQPLVQQQPGQECDCERERRRRFVYEYAYPHAGYYNAMCDCPQASSAPCLHSRTIGAVTMNGRAGCGGDDGRLERRTAEGAHRRIARVRGESGVCAAAVTASVHAVEG